MRENRTRRKPKVSYGRSVRVGLVGPKPRPRGVGDGKQINISAPLIFSDGGTQEVMFAGERKCQFKHVAWSRRKIRETRREV